MDLTDQDLEGIVKRCQATPPGPWQSFVEGRDHFSGGDFVRTGHGAMRGPDLYVSLVDDDGSPRPAPVEILDFVAAARQDIPRLVDEIRRLRDVAGGIR